jgi:hypothetical protein
MLTIKAKQQLIGFFPQRKKHIEQPEGMLFPVQKRFDLAANMAKYKATMDDLSLVAFKIIPMLPLIPKLIFIKNH